MTEATLVFLVRGFLKAVVLVCAIALLATAYLIPLASLPIAITILIIALMWRRSPQDDPR